MNLINYLGSIDNKRFTVEVYTFHTASAHPFQSSSPRIKIRRYGRLQKRQSSWVRYLNYTVYYLKTLVRIIQFKPDVILSYETLSVFPAVIYKRVFYSKAKVMIHYHEYVSPAEYANGMRLTRWLHTLEKKL